MLTFRKPNTSDMDLYFRWANDPDVRRQSFNSAPITLDSHKKWFYKAIKDKFCFMYLFQNEGNENVGQIRIYKKDENEAIIGISIDANHRGRGYAKEMIVLATSAFLKSNKDVIIHAYIKETNLSSKFSFEKAGFEFVEIKEYQDIMSFYYIKKAYENR